MNRTTAILAGAILLGTGAAFTIPDPPGLEGNPRVVDGDTLAFGSIKVRIWGIDAFESHSDLPATRRNLCLRPGCHSGNAGHNRRPVRSLCPARPSIPLMAGSWLPAMSAHRHSQRACP
jgi:hypothetical protein